METAQRYYQKEILAPVFTVGVNAIDTESNTLDINIYQKEAPMRIQTLNPSLCNDPKHMKHHTIATPPNCQWKVKILGQYVTVLLF